MALLHSPAIVFTQDRALRYTWIHHPARPRTGLKVVGRTDADLLPAADARRLTSIKRHVLQTGRGRREMVHLTGAAGGRWYDLSVEPLLDRRGSIVGITCATWDVTEHRTLQAEAQQSAVLAERNRLAGEVHDSLAQGLVAVILRLEAAEHTVANQPSRAVQEVRAAREMVRGVLDEARRAARAMRPRLLDQASLPEALERLVGDLGTEPKVSMRVLLRGKRRTLGQEVEDTLLRVAQEALQNAVRHAKARHIVAELAFHSGGVRLRIRDDGRGFDTKLPRVGLGLGIMRERVRQVGGELRIDSAAKRGTRVQVRLALPAGGES